MRFPTILAVLLAVAALPAQAAPIQKLDKFLPAKVPGWITDPPFDDTGMSDHTHGVNQTFSAKNQEGGLDFQIQRIRPDSRIGLPKLEKAKLGQLPEGGGFASMQVVKGHNALTEFDAENKSGKVTMVAGRCVVIVEGHGLTQPQLLAAAATVDLKGLDAECQ